MILKKTIAIAGASALAFSLGACSSDSSKDEDAMGDSAATGGGIVSVFGSEPQNPLVPQNTNETGGGRIIDSLFSGLVYYDAKGAVHNEMADSITASNNNQTYTIKIKPDMKFSDGTAVDADSFVDAWNYAVEKETNSTYFFEPIKGYEPGKKLEGLKKIDDLTFQVDLAQPESDFALRLGYSAFYPLPKAAFDDMKAYGENPITNGPYKLKEWQHNAEAVIVPNEEYTGVQEVKNGGIKFVFYPTPKAAYTDLLAGSLDVIDTIPANAQTTFQKELGDRAVVQPAAVFQSFTIPEALPHFQQDEEGRLRRQAISMSIDRQLIIDKLYAGMNKPAKDFTSPVIDGWSGDIPGNEVTEFNPEKAKELWKKADAISPWSGEFTLAYNADGGHQEWVDAVTNQIKNTLEIKALGKPYPDFKSFRDDITNRKMTGAFRTGWQADYPALANFLGPVYGTGAGSNDGDYSDAEFDSMLKQGAAAKDPAEANEIYNKSQEILFKDLPAIPLYYGVLKGGYGEDVSNVQFAWNSQPVYNEIVKK